MREMAKAKTGLSPERAELFEEAIVSLTDRICAVFKTVTAGQAHEVEGILATHVRMLVK